MQCAPDYNYACAHNYSMHHQIIDIVHSDQIIDVTYNLYKGSAAHALLRYSGQNNEGKQG